MSDVAGISLRGVSKTYRGRGADVVALQDMNLDCPPGSFTALIGPSGCGKSTAMRIALGLEDHDAGEVKIAGQAPATATASGITGVAFQDAALLPWRTVARNVSLPLEVLARDPKRYNHEITKLIELVGLKGYENALPHQLSGGMRQRVGLARALSVDAPVLLLDEPFSAVDEQTRRKFQEDLLQLVANEKKTFIFVTHSIEEAVYVSDQIAILLPRPSRVSEVIRPSSFRDKGLENIRRDPEYLDIVDRIWASLRSYVE